MWNKSKKDRLNKNIENLIEMIELKGSKFEIIKRNFIAGISRGIGIGIGVTVVTAILVLFLNHLVSLNIPIIGEYIADIVDIVEKSR